MSQLDQVTYMRDSKFNNDSAMNPIVQPIAKLPVREKLAYGWGALPAT